MPWCASAARSRARPSRSSPSAHARREGAFRDPSMCKRCQAFCLCLQKRLCLDSVYEGRLGRQPFTAASTSSIDARKCSFRCRGRDSGRWADCSCPEGYSSALSSRADFPPTLPRAVLDNVDLCTPEGTERRPLYRDSWRKMDLRGCATIRSRFRGPSYRACQLTWRKRTISTPPGGRKLIRHWLPCPRLRQESEL